MTHPIINSMILILPLISGYVTSFVCKMDKTAGSNVKSRPPSFVFGIVWPILYLSIGLIWVIARKYGIMIDILMGTLTILLSLWIIIYSCKNNKRNALYILLLINLVSLMIYGFLWSHREIGSSILFTVFLGWINFAIMMNFTEVEKNIISLK